MKISRNNYEVWFIDFYDRKLSQKEVDELRLFLDQHTDLKKEFDHFSQVQIESPEVSFHNKQLLKKDNNDIKEYTNNKLIALLEGDLDEEQCRSLEKNLENNTHLKNEYQLLQLTKLKPELTTKFKGKKRLKQPIPLLFSEKSSSKWLVRIAAIFLVLLIGTAVLLLSTRDVIPERQTGDGSGTTNINKVLPNEVSTSNSQENDLANSNNTADDMEVSDNVDVAMTPSGKDKLYTEKKNEDSPGNKPDIEDQEDKIVGNENPHIESIPSSSNLIVNNSGMDESLSTMPELIQVEKPKEEYLGVFGGLKSLAKKEVAKSMELDDDSRFSNELSDDNYKKVKLLDIVGLGISRASKDKVKLKTREDKDGKVTARGVSVSAGD